MPKKTDKVLQTTTIFHSMPNKSKCRLCNHHDIIFRLNLFISYKSSSRTNKQKCRKKYVINRDLCDKIKIAEKHRANQQ